MKKSEQQEAKKEFDRWWKSNTTKSSDGVFGQLAWLAFQGGMSYSKRMKEERKEHIVGYGDIN
jgi:hypothetical protein